MPDGTFRIYPGTPLNGFYEPRKRPWLVSLHLSLHTCVLHYPTLFIEKSL